MAEVVFDYAAWSARFPELVATTPEARATSLFVEASYVAIGNDEPDRPPSLIADPTRRLIFLGLLVAHLAALGNRAAQGDGAGGAMVGNVASASEGSVSVSMAAYPVGSGKWFEQTQYGAQLWQMMQPLLRARYQPGPRPYVGVPRFMGWR